MVFASADYAEMKAARAEGRDPVYRGDRSERVEQRVDGGPGHLSPAPTAIPAEEP